MLRNFKNLHGCTLAASDGEIGQIKEIYFDDEHWKVRYFLVTTGTWLIGREVLISPHLIGGIDEQQRSLTVHLSREQVRQSPPVESHKTVSREYEEIISKHYGWDPYWSFDGGVGLGMPRAMPALVNPQTPVPPITSHLRDSSELSGYQLHATDGELGKVEDFILDDQGWNIRYLVIRPGNWLTQTQVLLSPEWIEQVSYEKAEIVVNLPSELIKTSPTYDASHSLTRDLEKKLHDHYERKGYWVPKNVVNR